VQRLHSGNYLASWGIRVFLMAAALLSAKEAAASGRLLGSQLSPLQGTISADLNGDRQSDMATAGTGRRDSHGYLQDITVRLSATELHTVTVRTAHRVHRLSVRDLDGDDNRDLVLESFDREPLAILLNDGEGHFRLGNLEKFRARLPRHGLPSVESPSDELPFIEIGQGAGNPTAAPATTGYRHSLTTAPASAHDQHRGVAAFSFHTSVRGPPAFRN
jgi:hypothetical protein